MLTQSSLIHLLMFLLDTDPAHSWDAEILSSHGRLLPISCSPLWPRSSGLLELRRCLQTLLNSGMSKGLNKQRGGRKVSPGALVWDPGFSQIKGAQHGFSFPARLTEGIKNQCLISDREVYIPFYLAAKLLACFCQILL